MNLEKLKKHIHYEQKTGVFTRLVQGRGTAKLGEIPTSDNGDGYQRIMVCGTRYKAHRLAHFYMTGIWPYEVDHRDGVKNNNKWRNLRKATDKLNSENRRKARSDSSTGLLGVIPRNNKFWMEIESSGRRIRSGPYDTAVAAHKKYISEKRKLHQGNTL